MLHFIKLIEFYQEIAPKDIRESCRFVPSCSEYMILAIKKYGCLKGMYKGFNRLLRCKAPNGGIDYP
jgi:putative membrane protein insertion efficiency factor